MSVEISVVKFAKKKELARLNDIAEGMATDNGPEGCPFCELFMHDGCQGCPISNASGFSDCRLSPYAEWVQHQSNAHFRTEPPYRIECPECRHLMVKVLRYTIAAPILNEDQLTLI